MNNKPSFREFIQTPSDYVIAVVFPLFIAIGVLLTTTHPIAGAIWIAVCIGVPILWFIHRYKTWRRLYGKDS